MENEKVLSLVLEFLKIEDEVDSKELIGVNGLLGLIDVFLLAEITEKIILKTKKEEEIKKILESFDDFKLARYCQVLSKEKLLGFKNLIFVVESRKKLKKTKGLS